MAIRELPEFNPLNTPLGLPTDEIHAIDQTMANLPRRPALVLFRFNPKFDSYHADPVYNPGVAWPDDALIVRARDLGKNENVRLYRYYDRLGQNREVYLCDPGGPAVGRNLLTRLGTVDQLASD